MYKIITIASLLLTNSYGIGLKSTLRSRSKHIDLMAAYSDNLKLEGSKDWELLNTYTKDPYFVEGFEMIGDN